MYAHAGLEYRCSSPAGGSPTAGRGCPCSFPVLGITAPRKTGEIDALRLIYSSAFRLPRHPLQKQRHCRTAGLCSLRLGSLRLCSPHGSPPTRVLMVVRRPIGSSSSLLTDLMDSCAAMLSYWICTNCRSTLPFLYDSLLLTRNRAEDPTQHNLLPKSILAQQGIIYAGPGRFPHTIHVRPKRAPHSTPTLN